MTKHSKSLVALLTAVTFSITQLGMPIPGWAAQDAEVKVSSALALNIPQDLGTIENFKPGNGPAILHIQTAHGNYEAQKNISAILHYLKDTYGVKTLFLEGGATKLKPEILRYFPDDMDLTRALVDGLIKRSVADGEELFLVEDTEAEAYGIENANAYRANREAFKAVLTEREKTDGFIRDMDMQIERLVVPYLNKDLRAYLKRLEGFSAGGGSAFGGEAKHLPLMEWLSTIKQEAAKRLEINLADPAYQIDWPMLVRIYKLQEFSAKLHGGSASGGEAKMDRAALERERAEFLKAIKRFARATYEQVEKLLETPLSHHQLPDPETGLLFEQMVAALPANFNYAAYPNVNLFIGHLILQSEIKADLLMGELDKISEAIAARLAETKEEKQILGLLADHRLLKRLFALELTPKDYDAIRGQSPAGTVPFSLTPSVIIRHFTKLNGAKRVRDIKFEHLSEIDSLFTKALEFYRLAKERDQWMMENIEVRLKETGADKVVVITGGFHSDPFRRFFEGKGYTYALISPNVSSIDGSEAVVADGDGGREAYIRSILQTTPNFLKAATLKITPAAYEPIDDRRLVGAGDLDGIRWQRIENGIQIFSERGILESIERLNARAEARSWNYEARYPAKDSNGKTAVKVDLLPGTISSTGRTVWVPTAIKRRITTAETVVPDFGRSESKRAELRGESDDPESRLKAELPPLRIDDRIPDADRLLGRRDILRGLEQIIQNNRGLQGDKDILNRALDLQAKMRAGLDDDTDYSAARSLVIQYASRAEVRGDQKPDDEHLAIRLQTAIDQAIAKHRDRIAPEAKDIKRAIRGDVTVRLSDFDQSDILPFAWEKQKKGFILWLDPTFLRALHDPSLLHLEQPKGRTYLNIAAEEFERQRVDVTYFNADFAHILTAWQQSRAEVRAKKPMRMDHTGFGATDEDRLFEHDDEEDPRNRESPRQSYLSEKGINPKAVFTFNVGKPLSLPKPYSTAATRITMTVVGIGENHAQIKIQDTEPLTIRKGQTVIYDARLKLEVKTLEIDQNQQKVKLEITRIKKTRAEVRKFDARQFTEYLLSASWLARHADGDIAMDVYPMIERLKTKQVKAVATQLSAIRAQTTDPIKLLNIDYAQTDLEDASRGRAEVWKTGWKKLGIMLVTAGAVSVASYFLWSFINKGLLVAPSVRDQINENHVSVVDSFMENIYHSQGNHGILAGHEIIEKVSDLSPETKKMIIIRLLQELEKSTNEKDISDRIFIEDILWKLQISAVEQLLEVLEAQTESAESPTIRESIAIILSNIQPPLEREDGSELLYHTTEQQAEKAVELLETMTKNDRDKNFRERVKKWRQERERWLQEQLKKQLDVPHKDKSRPAYSRLVTANQGILFPRAEARTNFKVELDNASKKPAITVDGTRTVIQTLDDLRQSLGPLGIKINTSGFGPSHALITGPSKDGPRTVRIDSVDSLHLGIALVLASRAEARAMPVSELKTLLEQSVASENQEGSVWVRWTEEGGVHLDPVFIRKNRDKFIEATGELLLAWVNKQFGPNYVDLGEGPMITVLEQHTYKTLADLAGYSLSQREAQIFVAIGKVLGFWDAFPDFNNDQRGMYAGTPQEEAEKKLLPAILNINPVAFRAEVRNQAKKVRLHPLTWLVTLGSWAATETAIHRARSRQNDFYRGKTRALEGKRIVLGWLPREETIYTLVNRLREKGLYPRIWLHRVIPAILDHTEPSWDVEEILQAKFHALEEMTATLAGQHIDVRPALKDGAPSLAKISPTKESFLADAETLRVLIMRLAAQNISPDTNPWLAELTRRAIEIKKDYPDFAVVFHPEVKAVYAEFQEEVMEGGQGGWEWPSGRMSTAWREVTPAKPAFVGLLPKGQKITRAEVRSQKIISYVRQYLEALTFMDVPKTLETSQELYAGQIPQRYFEFNQFGLKEHEVREALQLLQSSYEEVKRNKTKTEAAFLAELKAKIIEKAGPSQVSSVTLKTEGLLDFPLQVKMEEHHISMGELNLLAQSFKPWIQDDKIMRRFRKFLFAPTVREALAKHSLGYLLNEIPTPPEIKELEGPKVDLPNAIGSGWTKYRGRTLKESADHWTFHERSVFMENGRETGMTGLEVVYSKKAGNQPVYIYYDLNPQSMDSDPHRISINEEKIMEDLKSFRAEVRMNPELILSSLLSQIDVMETKNQFFYLVQKMLWGTYDNLAPEEKITTLNESANSLGIAPSDRNLFIAWASDYKLASVESSFGQALSWTFEQLEKELGRGPIEEVISAHTADQAAHTLTPEGIEEAGLYPHDSRVIQTIASLIERFAIRHHYTKMVMNYEEKDGAFLKMRFSKPLGINVEEEKFVELSMPVPQFIGQKARIFYDSMVLWLKEMTHIDEEQKTPNHYHTYTGTYSIKIGTVNRSLTILIDVTVEGKGEEPESVTLSFHFPEEGKEEFPSGRAEARLPGERPGLLSRQAKAEVRELEEGGKFFDRKTGVSDQGTKSASIEDAVIGNGQVNPAAFFRQNYVRTEPAQNPTGLLESPNGINAGNNGEFVRHLNGDAINAGSGLSALAAGVLVHNVETRLDGVADRAADRGERISLADTSGNGRTFSNVTKILPFSNQNGKAHLRAPFSTKFSTDSPDSSSLPSRAEARTESDDPESRLKAELPPLRMDDRPSQVDDPAYREKLEEEYEKTLSQEAEGLARKLKKISHPEHLELRTRLEQGLWTEEDVEEARRLIQGRAEARTDLDVETMANDYIRDLEQKVDHLLQTEYLPLIGGEEDLDLRREQWGQLWKSELMVLPWTATLAAFAIEADRELDILEKFGPKIDLTEFKKRRDSLLQKSGKLRDLANQRNEVTVYAGMEEGQWNKMPDAVFQTIVRTAKEARQLLGQSHKEYLHLISDLSELIIDSGLSAHLTPAEDFDTPRSEARLAQSEALSGVERAEARAQKPTPRYLQELLVTLGKAEDLEDAAAALRELKDQAGEGIGWPQLQRAMQVFDWDLEGLSEILDEIYEIGLKPSEVSARIEETYFVGSGKKEKFKIGDVKKGTYAKRLNRVLSYFSENPDRLKTRDIVEEILKEKLKTRDEDFDAPRSEARLAQSEALNGVERAEVRTGNLESFSLLFNGLNDPRKYEAAKTSLRSTILYIATRPGGLESREDPEYRRESQWFETELRQAEQTDPQRLFQMLFEFLEDKSPDFRYTTAWVLGFLKNQDIDYSPLIKKLDTEKDSANLRSLVGRISKIGTLQGVKRLIEIGKDPRLVDEKMEWNMFNFGHNVLSGVKQVGEDQFDKGFQKLGRDISRDFFRYILPSINKDVGMSGQQPYFEAIDALRRTGFIDGEEASAALKQFDWDDILKVLRILKERATEQPDAREWIQEAERWTEQISSKHDPSLYYQAYDFVSRFYGFPPRAEVRAQNSRKSFQEEKDENKLRKTKEDVVGIFKGDEETFKTLESLYDKLSPLERKIFLFYLQYYRENKLWPRFAIVARHLGKAYTTISSGVYRINKKQEKFLARFPGIPFLASKSLDSERSSYGSKEVSEVNPSYLEILRHLFEAGKEERLSVQERFRSSFTRLLKQSIQAIIQNRLKLSPTTEKVEFTIDETIEQLQKSGHEIPSNRKKFYDTIAKLSREKATIAGGIVLMSGKQTQLGNYLWIRQSEAAWLTETQLSEQMKAVHSLMEILKNEKNKKVILAAINSLALMGPVASSAVALLVSTARRQKDPLLRVAAVQAIGRIMSSRAEVRSAETIAILVLAGAGLGVSFWLGKVFQKGGDSTEWKWEKRFVAVLTVAALFAGGYWAGYWHATPHSPEEQVRLPLNLEMKKMLGPEAANSMDSSAATLKLFLERIGVSDSDIKILFRDAGPNLAATNRLIAALINTAENPALDTKDRARVVEFLGNLRATEAVPALIGILDFIPDKDRYKSRPVRIETARTLGKIGTPEAVAVLLQTLKEPDLKDLDSLAIRRAAVEGLAEVKGAFLSGHALGALMEALKDRDLRDPAARGLVVMARTDEGELFAAEFRRDIIRNLIRELRISGEVIESAEEKEGPGETPDVLEDILKRYLVGSLDREETVRMITLTRILSEIGKDAVAPLKEEFSAQLVQFKEELSESGNAAADRRKIVELRRALYLMAITLMRIEPKEGVADLVEMMKAEREDLPFPDEIMTFGKILSQIEDREANEIGIQFLIEELDRSLEKSEEGRAIHRVLIISILGEIINYPHPMAEKLLAEISSKDPNPDVRKAAFEALKKIERKKKAAAARAEARGQKGLPEREPEDTEVLNLKLVQEGKDQYGIKFWPLHAEAEKKSSVAAEALERRSGFFTFNPERLDDLANNPNYTLQRSRVKIKMAWLFRRSFEFAYRGVLLGTILDAKEMNRQVEEVAAKIYPLTVWEEPTDEEIEQGAASVQDRIKAEGLEEFIRNLRDAAAWLRTADPGRVQPPELKNPIINPLAVADTFEELATQIMQNPRDYLTLKDVGFSDAALGVVFIHVLRQLRAEGFSATKMADPSSGGDAPRAEARIAQPESPERGPQGPSRRAEARSEFGHEEEPETKDLQQDPWALHIGTTTLKLFMHENQIEIKTADDSGSPFTAALKSGDEIHVGREKAAPEEGYSYSWVIENRDGFVSRKQLALRFKDGLWFFRDLGSKNGVKYMGKIYHSVRGAGKEEGWVALSRAEMRPPFTLTKGQRIVISDNERDLNPKAVITIVEVLKIKEVMKVMIGIQAERTLSVRRPEIPLIKPMVSLSSVETVIDPSNTRPGLILTRSGKEKVYINENIIITVEKIDGHTVKLTIEAPKEIPIQELAVFKTEKAKRVRARAEARAGKKTQEAALYLDVLKNEDNHQNAPMLTRSMENLAVLNAQGKLDAKQQDVALEILSQLARTKSQRTRIREKATRIHDQIRESRLQSVQQIIQDLLAKETYAALVGKPLFFHLTEWDDILISVEGKDAEQKAISSDLYRLGRNYETLYPDVESYPDITSFVRALIPEDSTKREAGIRTFTLALRPRVRAEARSVETIAALVLAGAGLGASFWLGKEFQKWRERQRETERRTRIEKYPSAVKTLTELIDAAVQAEKAKSLAGFSFERPIRWETFEEKDLQRAEDSLKQGRPLTVSLIDAKRNRGQLSFWNDSTFTYQNNEAQTRSLIASQYLQKQPEEFRKYRTVVIGFGESQPSTLRAEARVSDDRIFEMEKQVALALGVGIQETDFDGGDVVSLVRTKIISWLDQQKSRLALQTEAERLLGEKIDTLTSFGTVRELKTFVADHVSRHLLLYFIFLKRVVVLGASERLLENGKGNLGVLLRRPEFGRIFPAIPHYHVPVFDQFSTSNLTSLFGLTPEAQDKIKIKDPDAILFDSKIEPYDILFVSSEYHRIQGIVGDDKKIEAVRALIQETKSKDAHIALFNPNTFYDADALSRLVRDSFRSVRSETRALEDLIDPALLNEDQRAAYDLLISLDQGYVFHNWSPAGQDTDSKIQFFNDVIHYDKTNPHGSLAKYWNAGIQLLQNAKTGNDPLKQVQTAPAQGFNLDKIDAEYQALEEAGLREANTLAFVLVAGGIGDRLKKDWSKGLPKIEIPVSLITGIAHLEKDIRTIDAVVQKSNRIKGEDRAGQFFIMTSDETHQGSEDLLAKLGFKKITKTYTVAGVSRERQVYVSPKYKIEIRLGKQEMVPAFSNNKGHFVTESDNRYKLVTKPHGHGDVHSLLYSSGTAEDWEALGIQHTLFFQDTNAPVVNAVLPALGLSLQNNFDINYLATARELGEPMGMLMRVTYPDGRVVTRNVEYSYAKQGVVKEEANAAGKSIYPGNMNVFIVGHSRYTQMLRQTTGVMAELINPKYTDASKGAFPPARPETNMQDLTESIAAKDFNVGVTSFAFKRFWFAPTKNDDETGASEAQAGRNPDTMDYTETAWYWLHRKILAEIAGVKIQVEPSDPAPLGLFVDHNPARQWAFKDDLPAVEWDRRFAATIGEVKNKFTNVEIENGSVLSIYGEDIRFENMKLKGALIVRVPQGSSLTVKGVTIQNNGHRFVKLSAAELNDPNVDEALRSRHYKVINQGETSVLDLTEMEPGDYLYDDTGLHKVMRAEARTVEAETLALAGILDSLRQLFLPSTGTWISPQVTDLINQAIADIESRHLVLALQTVASVAEGLEFETSFSRQAEGLSIRSVTLLTNLRDIEEELEGAIQLLVLNRIRSIPIPPDSGIGTLLYQASTQIGNREFISAAQTLNRISERFDDVTTPGQPVSKIPEDHKTAVAEIQSILSAVRTEPPTGETGETARAESRTELDEFIRAFDSLISQIKESGEGVDATIVDKPWHEIRVPIPFENAFEESLDRLDHLARHAKVSINVPQATEDGKRIEITIFPRADLFETLKVILERAEQRSELREVVPSAQLSFLTSAQERVVRFFTAGILPLVLLTSLIAGGIENAVASVSKILGRPAYASNGVTPTAPLESTVENVLGVGTPVITEDYFSQESQRSKSSAAVVSGSGRVYIDQELLEMMAKKNPLALFLLLDSFARKSADRPVLATHIDSESSVESFKGQIISALRNREAGVKEQSVIDELVKRLNTDTLLEVRQLKPGQPLAEAANEFIAANKGGVSTLHLNADSAAGYQGGIHFAFGKIHPKDLVAVTLAALESKQLADLLRDARKPSAAEEVLKQLAEVFPGYESQDYNMTFLIGPLVIRMLFEKLKSAGHLATMA